MKIFGIDFEPLGTPVSRHLEALSATIVFICTTVLFAIGYFLNFYILFFTRYWILALIYFIWIWIDIPTTVKGGRRSDWVRSSKLFKYAAKYYPISLTISPELNLDKTRNYIFCGYPHAIFPSGITVSLLTKALGVDEIFPNHRIYAGTLDVNLKAPLYRDFLMAIGMCSVSASSLNHILQEPKGGKVAVIIVGGAAEAYLSVPNTHKIVLKNRKGFVKLAIKNGTPLVPIYSFGEVDAFNQYVFPENSWIRRLQIWLKDMTSIAFPVMNARGIFQKSFGVTPRRYPINVVVGKAIEVEKNENPTKEEVEILHKQFMQEMTTLFEEYKYQFIADAENTKLIMV